LALFCVVGAREEWFLSFITTGAGFLGEEVVGFGGNTEPVVLFRTRGNG